MSQHTPEDARALLQQHVRKSVAISTLRKVARISEDWEAHDRRNARASRRIAVAAAIAAAVLVMVVWVTGGALPRLLTGLLF